MEDIDKNGDGFIDLEEYIGETLVLLLPSVTPSRGSHCHRVLPSPPPHRVFSLSNSHLPQASIEGFWPKS